MKALLCLFGVVLPVLLAPATAARTNGVQLLRTPHGGIQPQAVTDAGGAVHLLYFKGEPKAGDLFYTRQDSGRADFRKPIRVNRQSGSAVAVGTIRGAQLALGRNGRVHVVWNGAGEAKSHPGAAMFYARLNDAGTAFEPERDLITFAAGLDGGGSVAADGEGNVFVFWHAPKPGNTRGEPGRALFMARSTDDGKTFARESEASPPDAGACACCGMRAFADRAGRLHALYRGAEDKLNRDMLLLTSRDLGAKFELVQRHPWRVPTCPMSSAFFTASGDRTFAAWETDGEVFLAAIQDGKASPPASPLPGGARRKHPVVAVNARGEALLAWTEGTGWQRGGSVAWQVFDAAGRPAAEKGRAEGVPVWGLVAAVARADGSFAIFY
jgi:hypothetical protein